MISCLLIYSCTGCSRRRAWGHTLLAGSVGAVDTPLPTLHCHACRQSTVHRFAERQILQHGEAVRLRKLPGSVFAAPVAAQSGGPQ
jgi:hypothetical protein